jgi:glycosyltransferase involved in cell wall biosynthesis
MPPPDFTSADPLLRVSVIVPVLNERDSITPLVRALVSQTRSPDEIVVADGGSTDGTRQALESLAKEFLRLRVIAGPGPISENRNAAIAAAKNEVIACTDAGCIPEPDWLENLLAAFDEGAQWVAGFYRPQGQTVASTAAGAVMMTTLPEVNLDNFLPGGSSQAFLKSAWERVGGFPVGRGVGEDTLFGEQMRSLGYRPVFAPRAVVVWDPPPTLTAMEKKVFGWGRADGINQVRVGAYAKVLVAYWAFPFIALLAALWLPPLGIALLAIFALLVAYRTRHKYGVTRSLAKLWWIPVAHVRQQLAASAGWLSGYGFRRFLRKLWERLGGRPMAAIEGGPVRHNVDVLMPNRSEVTRWLPDLPSTYRIGTGPTDNRPVVFGTLQRRHRSEPMVAPLRVEGGELREVDPVARFEELRQSGLPYQLVPAPGGTSRRRDPIETKVAVVILAAVPLHDVGGGSRGAQLAQELASQGHHVSYVYRYDAAETIDLGLRFIHPLLEERRWTEFEPEAYQARVNSENRLVLVEFPHSDHLTLLSDLEGAVVYDLIDDWSDSALGGSWYQPRVESALIEAADYLIASAPSLVKSLQARAGRPVTLVPNAVNARLFDHRRAWSRPGDLPEGPIFEYHGSLYGDWFDWEAVRRVAEEVADSSVVLIGDRPAKKPTLPGNVYLLGLKPQPELPSYLAHTEVALIPFAVTKTTHAVSPLKAFEYLAMKVPVAAPPLEPLLNLDGVFLDDDLVAAVRAARAGEPPDPESIVDRHSWTARVATIFEVVGWKPVGSAAQPVRIEVRPVRQYSPDQRLLR